MTVARSPSPAPVVRTPADLAGLRLGFEDAIAGRVATMVAETLNAAPRPGLVVDLMARVIAYAEAAAAELLAHNPPPTPLACAAGCAHCCHNLIVTTPPQVLAIAAWLDEAPQAEARREVGQRLRRAGARQRGLSWPEIGRTRPVCPLLDGGRCGIYDLRPLGCRGWTSLDARRCERDFRLGGARSRGIPFYLPQSQLALCIERGVLDGLARGGRRPDKLALTQALAIALDTPDAASRWLAGDDIFAAARVPD